MKKQLLVSKQNEERLIRESEQMKRKIELLEASIQEY